MRFAAFRRGEATIVDTRHEGLVRCSRTFRQPDGAARVVVSHLGPGFVRGDRYVVEGDVGPHAALELEAQSATRLLGSDGVSTFAARWSLGAGARLTVVAEPTIAFAGAAHRSQTEVSLGDGASFAWLDTVAPHEAFGRIETSLRAFSREKLVLHDALHLTPRRLREAIGTLVYLRDGMSARRGAALVAAADAVALALGDDGEVTVGIGSPAAGGVVARLRGPHVRIVRAALAAILIELRRIDATDDVPFVEARAARGERYATARLRTDVG